VAAHLIEDADGIDAGWVEQVRTVGLSAGASTPELLVQDTIVRLQGLGFEAVREMRAAEEHVNFPLPRELRGAAVESS